MGCFYMLVGTKDAAAFLGIQETTLAILRSKGAGAPFTRKGSQVFYDTKDLESYHKIKSLAQRHGNTARHLYRIKVTARDGELQSIQTRRGVNLAHAVEVLSLYPSMSGCAFEEVQTPAAMPNQIERFRIEIDKNKPAMVEALKKSLTGANAAQKQAGSNRFDKLIAKAIEKAFR